MAPQPCCRHASSCHLLCKYAQTISGAHGADACSYQEHRLHLLVISAHLKGMVLQVGVDNIREYMEQNSAATEDFNRRRLSLSTQVRKAP